MSSKSIRTFIGDENGGYTVWSLTWFMLYVALGGIAVDMSDAFRNQNILQSTADASALAGVIELPDENAAVTAALSYSVDNMDMNINGHVLKDSEVIVGTWDFATRTFSPGGATPNAVRTVTRRDRSNNNPLATNFLPILAFAGIDATLFDISVEAIAARNVGCTGVNGVVANNKIDVTSNGHFSDSCWHGQNIVEDNGHDYALNIQNNNIIDPTAFFTMPSLDMMDGRPNVYSNNTGLADAVGEGDMWAKSAMVVMEYIDGLTLIDPDAPEFKDSSVPDYMFFTDGTTGETFPKIQNISGGYSGPYLPGYIYVSSCAGNQTISLPSDVLVTRTVITGDCRITGNNVILSDAVIASSAVGNGSDPLALNAIHLASNATIGADTFCTGGPGQVTFYTAASMHLAAGQTVYGVRMVAGGDIAFTANQSVLGFSAEAGNNFSGTSNGSWGYCGGTFAGPYEYRYALVQ